MSVVSGSRVDMGPSDGVRLVRARPLMRDGVRLNAAVYTPRGAESRVPAVVELTPYTIDHVHRDGQQFARSGLAYVVADVRGRGDSEGVFETVVRDGADGHDLIEWIVSQPWSDGRVVLFGGSYTGWNQWLILGHGHPAIAAASPAAAFASGWDIPRGGIPNLYHAKWQGMVFGHANYATSGADGGLWAAEIRDAMRQGRPVWTAAEPFGVAYDEGLRRQVESPDVGPAWADHEPSDEAVSAINVPILTISGTHDNCLAGTLYHWDRFERLAPAQARASSHLLVGPWDHAGTDSGVNRVGDLQFAAEATVEMRALRIAWFRHVLFGEPSPGLLSDRVVYYVAGAEEWHHTDSLGAATVGEFSLHLASSASPNDVFHSGWLGPEPEDGPDYVLRLDPADSRTVDLELIPRPGVAPDNPMFSLSYNSLLMTLGGDDPTNQVFVVSLDGDGIVYHSRLLTSPLTLVGKPRLRLALVPDADDADLAVLLHVVLPSGDTVLLSSDLIRLSRRDRGGPPRPLVPGEVNVVDIDDFRFCSRELPIGSRLRLTLRSAWSPLILPTLDGLTAHPVVTLRLVHRAEDGPVLRLPLGYVGEA